jgi:hypothetical protein
MKLSLFKQQKKKSPQQGAARSGIPRENIADILCIGTQKAGTSWLHTMCNIHPSTHSFPNRRPVTSTTKEAHFFDWNPYRGVEWYRNLMMPSSPGKLSMDFTPEYSTLARGHVKLCKEISPTAQVLFVVRDPIARAVSALRMHYLWYNKKHPNKDSIEFDDVFLKIFQESKLVTFSGYNSAVDLWKSFYPDMHILNYEDCLEDPRAYVVDIWNKIGLSYDALDEAKRQEFDEKLPSKVWESEKFPVSEKVLSYLHDVLEPHRDLFERSYGFKFTEKVT